MGDKYEAVPRGRSRSRRRALTTADWSEPFAIDREWFANLPRGHMDMA